MKAYIQQFDTCQYAIYCMFILVRGKQSENSNNLNQYVVSDFENSNTNKNENNDDETFDTSSSIKRTNIHIVIVEYFLNLTLDNSKN